MGIAEQPHGPIGIVYLISRASAGVGRSTADPLAAEVRRRERPAPPRPRGRGQETNPRPPTRFHASTPPHVSETSGTTVQPSHRLQTYF